MDWHFALFDLHAVELVASVRLKLCLQRLPLQGRFAAQHTHRDSEAFNLHFKNFLGNFFVFFLDTIGFALAQAEVERFLVVLGGREFGHVVFWNDLCLGLTFDQEVLRVYSIMSGFLCFVTVSGHRKTIRSVRLDFNQLLQHLLVLAFNLVLPRC